MSGPSTLSGWVGIGMGVGLFSVAWPVILPAVGCWFIFQVGRSMLTDKPGPLEESDEWLEDTVRRCPDFVDDPRDEAYFEVLLAEQVRRRIAD